MLKKMPINIPNLLTLLRILLVPIFIWRYLTAQSQPEYTTAAAILLFSGLTDLLDGLIARSTGSITEWGKAFDPLADKLTQMAVMVSLWVRYPGFWPLYCLLILKEALMIAGGFRLYKRFERVESARWFGKLATVVFYVTMIKIIATVDIDRSLLLGLLAAVGVVMVFSWLMYLLGYIKILREKSPNSLKSGTSHEL